MRETGQRAQDLFSEINRWDALPADNSMRNTVEDADTVIAAANYGYREGFYDAYRLVREAVERATTPET